MKDIFSHTILCEKCGKQMSNNLISKNGFNLRVKECRSCNERIIHPSDRSEYEEFVRLKKKDFEVKMRMVGNSYAVSIPREIVDFMEDHQHMVNNMVRLSFDDLGKLSLAFNTSDDSNPHVVSTKEVKVVRNGKPILHARKFIDSRHPERNKTQILKKDEESKE